MARGFAPVLYFVRSCYVVVCLLARSLGQGLRASVPWFHVMCSRGSHITWNYSTSRPVAPALVPKAVSARGFLVPPLRSGHSSAPSGLFCRLAHPTYVTRRTLADVWAFYGRCLRYRSSTNVLRSCLLARCRLHITNVVLRWFRP